MEEKNRISYYEKMRCLGVGGLSDVWLVNDVRNKNTYAMKYLHTKHHQASKDSFLQEIEILKTLHHPKIPKLIECVHVEDEIYEIMEYIDGTSISSSYLFNEVHVVEIALQILDILQYLHHCDILYCDLKPDNLIMKNGQIYLVDFGASIKKDDNITMRYGTEGFAAPEQYLYEKINQQVDIYAFGKTMLSYILSQQIPSSQSKNILMKYNLSVYIKYIVLKCIQEDKRRRYNCVSLIQKDIMNVYFQPYMYMKLWFRFLIFVKYYWLIFFDIHWGAIKNKMLFEWNRIWKQVSLSKMIQGHF